MARRSQVVMPLAAVMAMLAGTTWAQAPSAGRREEASPYSRYLPDTSATRRAYLARPRTELERVLNYTDTGDEAGAIGRTFFIVWISGHAGGHPCEVTRFTHDGAGQTIDIRRMDPAAFDIRRTAHPWDTRVGVPGQSVRLHEHAAQDRVRALWQEAFRRCPYAGP